MKDYVLSLNANERQELAVLTRFLRVRSATGDVLIEGAEGLRVTMSEGDWFELPVALEQVAITDASGAANAVTLTIGDGRASSQSISGSVTVTSGSIAISNSPSLSRYLTEPNGTFYSTAVGTTATPIVLPAANTGGLEILRVMVYPAYPYDVRLMAKSSAPTSIDDAGARTISWHYSGTYGIQLMSQGDMFRIPAGEGVYAIANGGSTSKVGVEWRAL